MCRERAYSYFGVYRLTLREILLAGLEGMVHFGKTFVRFDQSDDGQVCASFADGIQVYGDLLVGADGTNSVVRNLLVPDARIDDLDSAIYGKTPITSNTLKLRLPSSSYASTWPRAGSQFHVNTSCVTSFKVQTCTPCKDPLT